MARLSRRRRLAQKNLQLPPPAVLIMLYTGFITVGSLLLRLPFASTQHITWLDAFFTATSAVTVTGLIVVDTGSAYTVFGQAVIAVLIQFGGLGLMVFAALVLGALGIRIQMAQQMILKEDLGQTSVADLGRLVRAVFFVALAAELVGVALLATVFVPEFGVAQGLWHAIFHTISALNNAGFALFSDSLSGWVGSPVMNITITALFILGGIGFVVIADVWEKRSWGVLTLHSKLMLTGTLALIIWAWLTVAALEWNNPGTLGGLATTADRVWASWFMAVTPRTAGFNTIDIGALENSTSLMTIALMLVGGGPTSTAGGIKVTTMIVLILATVSFFRRREQVHAFGRSLETEQVMKVMALTTITIFTVMFAIFLVMLTHEGDFHALVFEVASAFGTVGLSRGATGELDAFGQIVIMVLMFLGRVGPLTLGFILATRTPPRVGYPRGQIYLG